MLHKHDPIESQINLKTLGRNLPSGAYKDIRKTEYRFFKDLERIVFIALVAVEMMRFLCDNFQILFQTADIVSVKSLALS